MVNYVIAARLLGVTSFGRLTLVMSTGLLMAGVLASALSQTTSSHVSRHRAQGLNVVALILRNTRTVGGTAAFLVTLVLMLFADPIARHLLADGALAWPLRIAALLIPAHAALQVRSGTLIGLNILRPLLLANVVGSITTVAGVMVGARYVGLSGALFGMLLGPVTTAVYLDRVLVSFLPEVADASVEGIGFANIIRFGSTATAVGFLTNAALWLGPILMAHAPNGFAEVAGYNAAYQLRAAAGVLPGLVGMAALPIFGEEARNRSVLRRKVLVITLTSAAITAIAAGGVFLLRTPLLSLFGSGFSGSAPTVAALCLSMVFVGPFLVLTSAFYALDSPGAVLRLTVVWASVLLGSFLLVPSAGATEFAACQAIAYSVVLVFAGVALSGRLREVPDASSSVQS